jgi:diguanylate cyclase (GGDEF)-like protein
MATLLIVQFLIYAVAWVLAAVLLREARAPALLWALYGAFTAAAFEAMFTAFQPGRRVISAPAAMLFVLAYACAALGMDAFMRQRWQHLSVWFFHLAAAESFLLTAECLRWPDRVFALGYNLFVFVLLVVPMLKLRRRVVKEFGAWGWAALAPGVLMAAILLNREAQWVFEPSTLQPLLPAASNSILMTSAMFAAGAFNVTFVGFVLGRAMLRLRRLVEIDPLSGLLNRAGLGRVATQMWQVAARSHQPLSVAFVDINDFKKVNDTAGHEAGDRAIAQVAAVLRRIGRGADTVGRWGGDEFLIWMPSTDAEGARLAAERIRAALQAEAIRGVGDTPITLSVGLATRRPDDSSVEALIERADADMYRDKSHA